MVKIKTIAAQLALLLLAGSCTIKVEPEISGPTNDAPDKLYASIDTPMDGGKTKVYIGEDVRLYWNEGDRISFFNNNTFNYGYKFDGQTGDRKGTFSKIKNQFYTSQDLSHAYAVYPYSSSTMIDEDSEAITVTLPAEQAYTENSFGPGANTMVSAGNDDQLFFRNVGGYLCLRMYGKGVSVSCVTLSGNNSEKIAGEATVTMEVGGLPETTMSPSATGAITLTCETPVSLESAADKYTAFWFVVPPVTFSEGFTVSVKDPDGGIFKKTTSKSFTIERNVILSMTPFEVASGE